ncbi:hypothetical protein HanPSC8_Chr10g0429871 [Helianthus annuus]|nr:hypothetical protein HanPSC8_Chr10g0429871 [Helianthus annuus]
MRFGSGLIQLGFTSVLFSRLGSCHNQIRFGVLVKQSTSVKQSSSGET